MKRENQTTAIGYGRFSSDMQREESITAQKRAIDEYCEKNDIILVDFFSDQGISGMTDERPGFQAMILAAEHVDKVIVHKLDRFARSRHDSIVYQKILEGFGTQLVSVLEQFDDSPESIILESVIVGMNEYYSRNLSREVKKGLLENARQGKSTGGTPPLGYDVIDGEYVLNESEAVIVRRIFEATLSGVSYGELAKELNAKGYRSKAGRPFVRNSFYDMLRNEKYMGTYIYNVSDSSSATGRRNYHKRHPEEKIIRIPDAIPAIISKEDFEKVRTIMERRKRGHYKMDSYFLVGLVYCGECGAPMNGSVTRRPGNKRYYYYKCNGRCGNRRIRADRLDSWISTMIADLFSHPKNAEMIVKQAMKIAKHAKQPGQIKEFEKREKELERKISNLTMALADSYSPAVKSALDELEEGLSIIQHEKIQLQQSHNKSYKHYLASYIDFANYKKLPEHHRKLILPMIIRKIKIHRDRSITVEFLNVPHHIATKVGDVLVQKDHDLHVANISATESGSTITIIIAS